MNQAILIVSPDLDVQKTFRESLGDQFEIEAFGNEAQAFKSFKNHRYEFTFFDIELLKEAQSGGQKVDYKSAIDKYRKTFPMANIVILAKGSMTRDAVRAVKAGADDYLNYPVEPSELALVTAKVEEQVRVESEIEFLRDQFWSVDAQKVIETKSPKMKRVYELVKSVAATRSTVLLTGETGVGKSMIAKLIHDHSTRKDGPFIPVHCGAISENLVESELFGHEKGAFTGAIQRKMGKFELAHGGTIFLDEIGTVSSNTQIKLLQVLQDSIFQRVGGETDIKVDVRVIAATNENLKEMVEEKTFRRDLLHRLSVFPVEIPPLRERREDIPKMLEFFLERFKSEGLKDIKGFRPEVLEALVNFEWTGNVREMENIVERAYILENTEYVGPESIPLEIVGESETSAVVPLDLHKTLAEARNEVIENFERQYLQELLAEKGGKISETAEAAGVGVRQIHKLMVKYGLSKKEFKEEL